MRKDANGSFTEYIYFNGEPIAEKTPSGWTDYIFTYGQRLAMAMGSATSATQYYHADHLGSERLMTDASGNVISNCLFAPFGQQVSCSPDNAANHYRFTGKERDGESALDNFGARLNGSSLGRFLSPDGSPSGVAMADPQSWNLYSYVRNRPTHYVDIGGNWATDIHAQIVTYALQGYLSAGELDELRARQYAMDADQSDQNRHSMANQGQSPKDALNAMWSFVASEMTVASQSLSASGQLNLKGLDALGDAMHTLQDFTSPMHTDVDFMPMVWNGGFWPPSKWRPGIVHLEGEGTPAADWSRIGYAVRLTMAAYLQSGAGCESGKLCLTEQNFESEVTKNIDNYVHHFYNPIVSLSPGSSHMQEEAARLCALGNPAACDE